MAPKVSVIIPVYKVEAYLEECVRSVQSQTFTEIEIILVDDGSPDSCPQMCDRFAAEDARIRVIHQQNGGVSRARNCGIEAAQGDWILFVDSDDWLEPDAIETLHAKTGDPDISVVVGSYYESYVGHEEYIEGLGEQDFLFPMEKYRDELIATTLIWAADYPGLFPPEIGAARMFRAPWAKLISRRIVMEHGLRFLPGVPWGEDTVFCRELLNVSKKISYINRPVCHYRLRESSVCNQKDDSWIQKRVPYAYANEGMLLKLRESNRQYYHEAVCEWVLVFILFGSKACTLKGLLECVRETKRMMQSPAYRGGLKLSKYACVIPRKGAILLLLKLRLYMPALLVCRVHSMIKAKRNSDLRMYP